MLTFKDRDSKEVVLRLRVMDVISGIRTILMTAAVEGRLSVKDYLVKPVLSVPAVPSS